MILFVALLALPEARLEAGRLVANHRVPRVPGLGRAASGLAAVVLVVALVAEFGGLDTTNLRRLTLALITALIMLSLVPLTGWAGQISLAQITFVGVGAFAMAEVAGDAQSWLGAGNPLGLVVAAAAAVPFGVLMALPALRLQGLYLALASMAFAVMAIPLFFSPTRDLRCRRAQAGDAALLRHRLRRRAQLPRARGGGVRGRSVCSSCGCAAARSVAGWSRCATARPPARPSA